MLNGEWVLKMSLVFVGTRFGIVLKGSQRQHHFLKGTNAVIPFLFFSMAGVCLSFLSGGGGVGGCREVGPGGGGENNRAPTALLKLVLMCFGRCV